MSDSSESLCPLMDAYLDLVDDTESPILYHRWCLITAVAGMLHRKTHIHMATGNVYPNMFTVLLGNPGARKSTAISMISKLIKRAGYTHIASGRTSPEQFLVDLKLGFDAVRIRADDIDVVGGEVLAAAISSIPSSHAIIQAGELQDFLGATNLSFISLLTNLWDNPDDYPYRMKDGTNELITYPIVSLLGGATQTTFKKMFPYDVLGQGLLSRFILVHGCGARKKIWMPAPLDAEQEQKIIQLLAHINAATDLPTEYKFTTESALFSKTLYENCEHEITDHRFQHYATRRNDHYMKLAMIIAAMNFHQELELSDCILANTILTYTEKFMPIAIGEFGLDHSADNTEYMFQLIKRNPDGITLNALVEHGLTLFKSTSDIAQCLVKLQLSKRIEKLSKQGNISYIPITRIVQTKSKLLDFELLKEYRENPTFDTTAHSDEEANMEMELSLATKAVKEELKLTKKAVGIRGMDNLRAF